jgi:acyl-CoA reductase-like NAD-dependent aldehyde dehydrogenase
MVGAPAVDSAVISHNQVRRPLDMFHRRYRLPTIEPAPKLSGKWRHEAPCASRPAAFESANNKRFVRDAMETPKLLINGELVAGDQTMQVINPATEEVLSDCPRASRDQLDSAVAAAKAAFPKWSKTDIGERRKLIGQIADVIDANASSLARTLTQEQGKPLPDAAAEVAGMAAFFRYFATLDLPMKVLEDSGERKIELHRRPLGVVGAIIPWNFPLLLLAFKMPPALLAGNTLVIKPAPTTPLSTLEFAALVAKMLPPGVVNFITDVNDLGDALTSHPDVAKISFTGSTATGKKVIASAANTLKRVTLELGGNDAGIVLGDVDPKKVAPAIFDGAFQNSGQVCLALKRLYVHESVYDRMCDELAELADAAIVDDGLKQGTKLGPLQNKMQLRRSKVTSTTPAPTARSWPAATRPIVPATSSARPSCATSPREPGWWTRSSLVRFSH